MNSKKGLSDIVTNVLIILLVLVAVSIIWVFLRPTIQGGAGQLGGATDCLTIQLEPVSCSGSSVAIRRGAGSGSLEDIKIVATSSGGISQVFDAGFSLNELETDTATLTGASLPAGTLVRVAAVVDNGDGGTRTCTESTISVTCA